MVTLEERESTRGRANLFRHLIQKGPDALYNSRELKDALELCISCKGCKSDCPASVDMATLKAEFEQGYMDRNGVSLSARAFASVTELAKPTQWIPGAAAIANGLQRTSIFKSVVRGMLGVSPKRTLPAFASRDFWSLTRGRRMDVDNAIGTVLLFVDEFTDRYEPEIAVAALDVLQAGGYSVIAPKTAPSGRGYLSKGFVRKARTLIARNVHLLAQHVDQVDAIVGIEPSAILTFVDEALDLLRDPTAKAEAERVAKKIRLVDNFVVEASKAGKWRGQWSQEARQVVLHGHCHQKAILGVEGTRAALSLPPNYRVEVIPSGCCGMAGSFGYRDEHYETSMQIGELVLLPAVRKASAETIVAAPGTSCRHQIHDGAQRSALHPIQVLRNALQMS
jgi:Fe-S oxidoreductase